MAIFFVLSAFLLYRPFVSRPARRAPAREVWRYARRRALRILPAYWVAVLMLGLLDAQHTPGVFGDQWWVYWGLLQSWSKETIISGIGVAWSLSRRDRVLRAAAGLRRAHGAAAAARDRDGQARLELSAAGASAVAALATRATVQGDLAGRRCSATSFRAPGRGSPCGLVLAVASAWVAPLEREPWPVRFATEHAARLLGHRVRVPDLAAWGVGLPRDPFAHISVARACRPSTCCTRARRSSSSPRWSSTTAAARCPRDCCRSTRARLARTRLLRDLPLPPAVRVRASWTRGCGRRSPGWRSTRRS